MIQKVGCIIFAALMLLFVVPVFGVDDTEQTPPEEQTVKEPYFGQGKSTDTIFKYEKKNRNTLLQMKGSGSSQSHADEDEGVFGLETLFGQLLFKGRGGYDGFYFLSGKLESDNLFRFNTTFGYYPAFIGGETRLTYRFLNANVLDTLSLADDVEGFVDEDYSEKAIEQGVGFSYKKRFKSGIREVVFNYAYTHLGGERLTTETFDINTPTVFRRVQADIGFGEIDTNEAIVGAAFGADAIDNPFLRGLRLDLQSGYQQAEYDAFDTFEAVTDRGFSGGAEMQACTPYGLFKAGYLDSQAAQIASGNYELGGLDFYYRHINYPYSDNEEIFGVAFTVDLFDPASSIDRACPRLFNPNNDHYDSVAQMSHIGKLAADEFTAKPQVRVVYTELLRVDKANLPSNVRVDPSPDNPRLIVQTGCVQRGLLSVSPQSASSAFSAGGQNIFVSMAALPAGQQSVTATLNDECCGDTQVRINTDAAATPSITSIRVQEQVGCVEDDPIQEDNGIEEDDSNSTSGSPALSCLAPNALCDINNDTCCPGTTCSLVSSPVAVIYRCQ